MLATSLAAALLAWPAPRARAADAAAGPRYPQGASFFQANCVVCHGQSGVGQPSLAPPLTDYPARYVTDPEGRRQLAMTLLYGMYGEVAVGQMHYNFKMPDFARFPDDALTAVLNYVVFDIAHAAPGAAPLTIAEIAVERGQPSSGDAVRRHRTALLAILGQ
jgi:mono/diheme cytochrome c family protein